MKPAPPGPGLSIRVLGEITEEKLRIMKEADDIFISELRRTGLYDKVWQAFCVLLPVKTVGVQGDSRTYDHAFVKGCDLSRWYDCGLVSI